MRPPTRLISDYFDSALEPEEGKQLSVWLIQERENLNDFLIDCFVHTQLIDLIGPEQSRANELVAAESLPKLKPSKPLRRTIVRALLAASVAFLLALGYIVTSRPSVVATISGTRNVQWALGEEKRTVGSLMRAGDEIALDRGTLHLTFARGGQVALHGPARFRFNSDKAGRLVRGSISAYVPEHAVGFTIRSAGLSVVDLGTEFYLEVVTDTSCELQVFDGLVEVQFDNPAASIGTDSKISIPQGRAVRLDTASGNVESVGYLKSMRLPMSVWSQ